MKKALSIVEFLIIGVIIIVLYFLSATGRFDFSNIIDFKKSNEAVQQKQNVDIELGKIQRIRNMQDDNYRRIQENY